MRLLNLFPILYFLAVIESRAQSIDQTANTVEKRFIPPTGFQRVASPANTYAHFLRQLPLKPWGTEVRYFDGNIKPNDAIYVSVIDLPIGKRDLHQCADAVMRLRAAYLYHQKKFDEIHFNFLADGKPRYFKTFAKSDFSYTRFWKYMEYVFASANTRSLHDELRAVELSQMQIGDVFIQKGVPFGHAVVVIDMAENPKTGQKVYLLAQSYMPAQELQILQNKNNPSLSPWYELKNQTIYTPEWTFKPADLRRF